MITPISEVPKQVNLTMPPKSEDPTLDVHKLKDETTSSDSSTNDENEEQATVSTAKLKYIIFDKHTVEILADKVVEVSVQSGMLVEHSECSISKQSWMRC